MKKFFLNKVKYILIFLFLFSSVDVFADRISADKQTLEPASKAATRVAINSSTHVPSYSKQLIPTDTYYALEREAFLGVNYNFGGANTLRDFLTAVFNWGIAVAVVLALIMIIWGGIEYMTTDSWGGKNEGKSKITNALQGLGLALVSYLLLYTINPCIVKWTTEGCTNTFINVPKAKNK